MRKVYIIFILVLVIAFYYGYQHIQQDKEIELDRKAIAIKNLEKYVESKGILLVNTEKDVSQSSTIEIIPYKLEPDCEAAFRDVVDTFGDAILKTDVSSDDKNVMLAIKQLDDKNIVLIKTENTTQILSGLQLCSRKIISFNICKNLNNVQECAQFSYALSNTSNLSESKDPCFGCCLIEYTEDGIRIQKYVCGGICGRVASYKEGETVAKPKQCFKDSCRADKSDQSCCKSTECVNQGLCYPKDSMIDVDDDGHIEACKDINGSGQWADPGLSKEFCQKSSL